MFPLKGLTGTFSFPLKAHPRALTHRTLPCAFARVPPKACTPAGRQLADLPSPPSTSPFRPGGTGSSPGPSPPGLPARPGSRPPGHLPTFLSPFSPPATYPIPSHPIPMVGYKSGCESPV
jgi:hypothetical protein